MFRELGCNSNKIMLILPIRAVCSVDLFYHAMLVSKLGQESRHYSQRTGLLWICI